ncbi:MAG: transporter substrate-binding domain-containing protein [Oscillospiraceae bacterium]
MISKAKKYVAVLLPFVCVCMIFSPQTAYAAEDSSQHETVKVGFFAMDGYHVMDEEGNRSGYGYDFLRLMARYWDVDYEYVGYDKSWDDMQQMLEDGEIDMVTSARITPDREEKFDFSRPIGTNNGMLTVRSDNSTIVDGNYSTYNGMRVALLNGNSGMKSLRILQTTKDLHMFHLILIRPQK